MDQQTEARKKVMLSGIQPSGELHLGNYLGAVKNWSELAEEFNCYYFIINYSIPRNTFSRNSTHL